MARGPEGRFKDAIRQRLSNSVHAEALGGTSSNGVPDFYYEGRKGALWVEYKFICKVPLAFALIGKPLLSKPQARWLTRSYENGQRVAVIVGHAEGGVIYPRISWQHTEYRDRFLMRLVSRAEIVQWIIKQVS